MEKEKQPMFEVKATYTWRFKFCLWLLWKVYHFDPFLADKLGRLLVKDMRNNQKRYVKIKTKQVPNEK